MTWRGSRCGAETFAELKKRDPVLRTAHGRGRTKGASTRIVPIAKIRIRCSTEARPTFNIVAAVSALTPSIEGLSNAGDALVSSPASPPP
jgi:hypothetical protein